MERRRFGDGLAVAAAVGTVELTVLVAVLTPTHDYRARLWFLLHAKGPGLPLVVYAWAAVWVPAVVLLCILKREAGSSVAGAGIGAVAVVLVLTAGVFTWVPEFTSSGTKIGTVGVVAIVAALLLRWELRREAEQRMAVLGPRPNGSR